MKTRLAPGLLLSFAFLARAAYGAGLDAAQKKYLAGEPVAPGDAKPAEAGAVQAARDIQKGPRSGESAQAYGLRAQAVGLTLGLSPQEAAQARDFYAKWGPWAAAARNGGGGLLHQGDPRAQAEARARMTALMRDPNWRSPDASGTFAAFSRPAPNATGPYRAGYIPNPNRPQAKPRPVVAPVPEPSAKDQYYRQSTAVQARAASITEKSSGDSAMAWFRRKGLELQASYYGLMGFARDPDTQAKVATQAGKAYLADLMHPKTPVNYANPAMVLLHPVAQFIADQIVDDAKTAYHSTRKAGGHFSFWNAADATTAVGSVGLDLASVTPAGAGRTAAREGLAAAELGAKEGLTAAEAAARESASAARAATREAAAAPRPWLAKAGVRPETAALLEKNYQRIGELNELYMRRKIDGAPREELDAIRRESWDLYNKNAVEQKKIPALRDYFAKAAPGTPASHEVMQAAAANMGVELQTMPKGVRLAGRNSLGRDLEAGAVLPNPGKALDDGTITGTGAHLLRDGSPHMVSVADRLTGGAVLLMTGFADANREKKTLTGIMYEFEQVADAAKIPPTREVFTDALTQGETVVPQVPVKNIKRVRSWRAEINPANPSQLIFRYTEPLALNPGQGAETILRELDAMPHDQVMRVAIPGDPDVHIRR